MQNDHVKKGRVSLTPFEWEKLKKQCYKLGLGRIATAGGLKSYQAIGQLLKKGYARASTIQKVYNGIDSVLKTDKEDENSRLAKCQEFEEAAV